MKKAKIILTSLALLAVIGGALAVKASRFQLANIWYVPIVGGQPETTITTTLHNGLVYSTTIINCTKTCLRTTDVGPIVNTSSSTTSPISTKVFTRVGGGAFTTTYHYCTLFVTRTTLCGSF